MGIRHEEDAAIYYNTAAFLRTVSRLRVLALSHFSHVHIIATDFRPGFRFLQQSTRQKSEAAAQRRLEQNSKELIVILAHPKVGSSTVWHSLLALNLKVPIYHVHFLAGDASKSAKAASASHAHKTKIVRAQNRRAHSEALNVLDQFFKQKKCCNVVTLVRDPVSTFVSSFFQGWRYDIPHLMEYDANNMTDEQIAALTALLMKKRDRFLTRWESWFDTEIKDIFGIDVFASPFDRAAGYQIDHAERAGLLLLTLESLNRCHKAAFQDFMQLPDFQLMPTNVGASKKYNAIYKEFTRRAALAADFLDAAYQLSYVKHFYTAEEIATFRSKWERASRRTPREYSQGFGSGGVRG